MKILEVLKEGSRKLDICKNCDRYNTKSKTCKECGCFMALKTKIKTSKCPLGKW